MKRGFFLAELYAPNVNIFGKKRDKVWILDSPDFTRRLRKSISNAQQQYENRDKLFHRIFILKIYKKDCLLITFQRVISKQEFG